MAGRRHRLMLVQFSQEITKDEAVQVAKFYGLPGAVVDKIERTSSGMTLVQSLEQRRLISEGEDDIMNEFCQNLYDLRLDRLADKVKEAYPDLPAEQRLPPIRVMPVGGSTEMGRPITQPASTIHVVGGGIGAGDYCSTDVSDAALSELSGCIGSEWKQIALGSLNLKNYTIEQIEEDNNKLRDRITAAFVTWRRQNAGNAGAGELLRILGEREDVDDDALKVLERYT